MITFRNIFTTLMYTHPTLLLITVRDILTLEKLNCTEAALRNGNFPEIRLTSYESPLLSSSVSQVTNFPAIVPVALQYLELECKANYPVLWGFEQYPYISWEVDTKRKVTPTSSEDEFISNLRFYSFRIFDLEHRFPTCYNTRNKCLQTTLTSIKQFTTSNETAQLVFNQGLGFPVQPSRQPQNSNQSCTIKLGYDELSQRFYCHTTTGDMPEILFRSCSNPVSCSALITPTNCSIVPEISIDDCTEKKSCRIASLMVNYLPAVATCVSSGKDMNSAYLHYFYSLPMNHNSKSKVFRYFNWDDAPPEDMLELSPLESNNFYSGDPFNISCNASYYYFSSGLKFRIEGQNGHYVRDVFNTDTVVKIPSTKRGFQQPLNLSALVTEQLKEPGKYQITCSAPVWNSSEWISKSMNITVLRSEEPKILGGIETEGIDYEPNMTLNCIASGTPKPMIIWLWNRTQVISDQLFNYRVSYEGNISYTWSKLHFPNSEANILKNVTCVASNCIGNDTKDFQLISRNIDEMDPSIFVIVTLVVVFVVVLTTLIWKITRERKNNVLTKREWKVFMEGKLNDKEMENSLVNCEKNSTYVNDVILEYLPYDKSLLEIGREYLLIDRGSVLGVGAYGVVWKASLKDRGATQEEVGTSKKSFEGLENNNSSLAVAVKTLRKDSPFDGKHFKALLSELKILNYIGNHKHIVNLVGASTKNLMKGKIYIVLELCENGSLLEHIRDNRKIYNISESEYCYNGYSKHESFGNDNLVFSETEICKSLTKSETFLKLMKWSLQITDAMEYLARKLIVHGDLALRNTLLSKNWDVKITDFGLSNKLNEKSYSPTAAIELPYKWLAIECLQSFKCYLESDIWSFGITLWELLSLGESPYAGMEMELLPPQNFLKELQEGERLEQPTLATPEIYEVMKKCWHENRKHRPSFTWLKNFIIQCLEHHANGQKQSEGQIRFRCNLSHYNKEYTPETSEDCSECEHVQYSYLECLQLEINGDASPV